MDVARKVVILARECGLQLSMDQLDVASLVPQPLAALATPADYMQALPQVRRAPAGRLHVSQSLQACAADPAAAVCTLLCHCCGCLQHDAEMAAQADAAAAAGEVLRYVGHVDVAAGRASVTTARCDCDCAQCQALLRTCVRAHARIDRLWLGC